MASLAEDLVARGLLPSAERDAFVARIHEAARRDRFSMRLTMFAVVASAPGPSPETSKPPEDRSSGGSLGRG
jgi:hypothetical protein